jgi:hypothetical protein
MNIRDIFRLVLKVLGIFMLKDVALGAYTVVTFLFGFEDLWGIMMLMVAIVVVLGALVYILLFRTDKVIDTLRLDEHFSTSAELSIEKFSQTNLKPLISLALLLSAVYLLATEIPTFLYQLYSWYQVKRIDELMAKKSLPPVLLAATKILVAYVLINACNPISSFIERKRSKTGNNS